MKKIVIAIIAVVLTVAISITTIAVTKYLVTPEIEMTLEQIDGIGKEFLKSTAKPSAAEKKFAEALDNNESTVSEIKAGEFIQIDFDELTSVNTFVAKEKITTTDNQKFHGDVRDFRIEAWNGKEWQRVYRGDLIEGHHQCVLEQDVMTYSIRLCIDKLADGVSTASITTVRAEYQGPIKRDEKFALTAFIGDQSYWQDWDKVDSDVLMSYDDIIMIQNWCFDEKGELVINAAVGENKRSGSIRTFYKWDSKEADELSKTFIEKYNALYDPSIKEEDKPNRWMCLWAMKDDPAVLKYDDSFWDFDPMDYPGEGKQPGMTDAYHDPQVRKNLVENVIAYVQKYDFYGVDIDWEYPYGASQQEDYYNLIKELGTELHKIGKKLSIDQLVTWCALPYEYYNDPAIDRINLMTYSHEGSGTDRQHSAYWDACVNAIERYSAAGVDLSKLHLGVPFYGTNRAGTASTGWRDWVTKYYVMKKYDRGINYYGDYSFNDPNVLQDKVLYSLQSKLGGIMVWWIKNDYTKSDVGKTSGKYYKDLTLTYYLRDAVDKFSYVANK